MARTNSNQPPLNMMQYQPPEAAAAAKSLQEYLDSLQDRIAALEAADTALDTRLDTAEATLDDHETRITALEGAP